MGSGGQTVGLVFDSNVYPKVINFPVFDQISFFVLKNSDNSGVHRFDWLIKYFSQGLTVGDAWEPVAGGPLSTSPC